MRNGIADWAGELVEAAGDPSGSVFQAPRSVAPLRRMAQTGHLDIAARRAMLVPVLLGLLIGIPAVALSPWPPLHRLVLVGCIIAGGGFIAGEYFVPWERIPPLAYLPVPALGLVDIGAAMWASGGWSSPFMPFLALPVAYAVTATSIAPALPVAVLAGLIAASPGLYTPRTSFWIAVAGTVPAYATLVGVIGVIMGHLRSSDRTAALEAVARQASDARATDLLTLQRVSAIVARHLTLEDAVAAIVHELSSTFGHGLISMYLFDGQRLVMQAQVGYAFYYEEIEVGAGIIGSAFSEGRTVFVPDVRVDRNYVPAEDDVISEIAVPLFDDEQVVGVLNVESRARLYDRDCNLMELFGAQVSVVLRNARLAGELRSQAARDPLTGLLNHRALMDALQEALSRRDARCALLLIDLDGFKQVNDTYGHLAGDAVLQHIAGVLRTGGREGDCVARYGGDEFVVVLLGAGQVEAASVADRIAATASAQPYPLPGELPLPLTLSIGVAVAPHDGDTPEDLLTHADRSMYGAKRALADRRQQSPA